MAPRHAYRPDLDGLRAVAVLAVLAFHAFPKALPGGFAGVDVFFVISGFLISGIIFEALRAGRFSYTDFYWRRVRRIFPALVLVLAACLGLGWMLLLPDEYRNLGRHALAGAGFLSNIVLWREAGYFATAAELKPLLHLWSLGVEEQYYLVWPLALALFAARPRALPWMIAGLAAASFALNLWLTPRVPSAAFYLPMTRFWELMAGSALAYHVHYGSPGQRMADLKAAAGLVLVAAGIALLSAGRAFPGWWALPPVVGTALLINAGPAAWINRRILSNPVMVHIGLISYPLYLWHWPLLSYARISEGGEPPAALRLALLATSFVLAWLTYELVEKKIRFARAASVKRLSVPALGAAMAVVGAFGLAALQSRVLPQSASIPLVNEISRASADWGYKGDQVIPGDSRRTVLFLGDSHMQQYWARIEKLLAEHAAPVRTIVFKTVAGCAPVPGIERRSLKCSQFVDEGLAAAMRPEVETVVIAGSWVGFLSRGDYYRIGDLDARPLKLLTPETDWVMEGFQDALGRLVRAGKRVVIVLSSPRGEVLDPKSVIERDGMAVRVRGAFTPLSRSDLAALTGRIDARLKAIAQAVGATVIDPADWLCTPSQCPAADEAGRPLYRDASHLRASAARERFGAVDSFVYIR
jgi:peptidoglycan/LPS O-acetylase OafA/YrhL